LLAADFFSVDTIFFKRHICASASRRVLAATCTAEPTRAWVTQQAKSSWKPAEEGVKPSVIQDRGQSGRARAVGKLSSTEREPPHG
jgi:hypothetical protein